MRFFIIVGDLLLSRSVLSGVVLLIFLFWLVKSELISTNKKKVKNDDLSEA